MGMNPEEVIDATIDFKTKKESLKTFKETANNLLKTRKESQAKILIYVAFNFKYDSPSSVITKNLDFNIVITGIEELDGLQILQNTLNDTINYKINKALKKLEAKK